MHLLGHFQRLTDLYSVFELRNHVIEGVSQQIPFIACVYVDSCRKIAPCQTLDRLDHDEERPDQGVSEPQTNQNKQKNHSNGNYPGNEPLFFNQ